MPKNDYRIIEHTHPEHAPSYDVQVRKQSLFFKYWSHVRTVGTMEQAERLAQREAALAQDIAEARKAERRSERLWKTRVVKTLSL